jgi:ubiquinone/menaquinone biosynthesis C-methylase UbiE
MQEWLSKLGAEKFVLDLGSGSGSFDYSPYPCRIVALDNDSHSLHALLKDKHHGLVVDSVCHLLPFKDKTFRLVVCNNTLEHFVNLRETLEEIGRVLETSGSLIVTVPYGYGFDDNLYRYLMEGGGHVNRFRFKEIVRLIEECVDIRLVKWQELYSSYTYLKKPLPTVLPHLKSRFRRLAKLPAAAFLAAQFSLNILIRLMSRWVGSDIALYGWAFYFQRNRGNLERARAAINVCMRCGAGHESGGLARSRRAKLLYRCPSCNGLNPYFKPRGAKWQI